MSQFFPEGMICAQIAFFSFWMGLPPKPQQPIKVHQPTKDFFDLFRRPFFVKKLFFSHTNLIFRCLLWVTGDFVTVTQQNRFSTGLFATFFAFLPTQKMADFSPSPTESNFWNFYFWILEDFLGIWRSFSKFCSIKMIQKTLVGDIFRMKISRNQLLFSLKSRVSNSEADENRISPRNQSF